MSLKKFNRKSGHSMGGIPPGSAKSKRHGASIEVKPAVTDATAVKKPNMPKTYEPLKSIIKKNNTIPGQSISPDGIVRREDEPNVTKHEAGPQQDDLIRGKHLQYDKEGNVLDLDYKVQHEKDTTDGYGEYSIYKTMGIKGEGPNMSVKRLAKKSTRATKLETKADIKEAKKPNSTRVEKIRKKARKKRQKVDDKKNYIKKKENKATEKSTKKRERAVNSLVRKYIKENPKSDAQARTDYREKQEKKLKLK